MGGGGEGVDHAGWVDPGKFWKVFGKFFYCIVTSFGKFIVTVVDPGDPWPTDRLHWDYNPLGWLKAKAVDDDCENLWRIHNNLYDLSQWINKHPGECKICTSGGCLLSFKISQVDDICIRYFTQVDRTGSC